MTGRLRNAFMTACLLAAAMLASLLAGAKLLPPSSLLDLLQERDSEAALILAQLRLPRLVLGLVVGAALGAAGAIIQAATRNPLGDPGLLGINAGASLAVIIGSGLFVLGPAANVWLASGGAALAALAVHVVAGAPYGTSAPVKLTLAGVAVTAFCFGVGQAIALADPERFDLVRNWRVGALSGNGLALLPAIAAPLLAGAILAALLAPRLNLLALGEDRAAALGLSVGWTQAGCLLAVVLLAGAAVAAAGPIAFIGLAAPHIARRLGGVDQRIILPLAAFVGAALVAAADALGRVAAPPAELPVGIVSALIGAPILVALAQARRGQT
ncbi:iron chelate uptake ABC transporter family permease subunit [Bosea sp. NPDC003192]|uniref:iron chelate uptake ABC transporter family permease subunit n=1 Tax=Bosea sp. NPDC003192 TaxID=3390551 RepID=UPI003D083861